MKTLQQQGQQAANAAMFEGTAAPLQLPALEDFTAYELEMAEVLAGLSDSITSKEERNAFEASVTLGSSSPRWVNAQPPAREVVLSCNPGASGGGDEKEDKQEVSGSKRKPKHYRSIVEIYRATDQFARYNLMNKKE